MKFQSVNRRVQGETLNKLKQYHSSRTLNSSEKFKIYADSHSLRKTMVAVADVET